MNLLEFARSAISSKPFATDIATAKKIEYITSDYITIGSFVVWMLDVRYTLPNDTLGFRMTFPAEIKGFLKYKPQIGIISGRITDSQGSYDFTPSELTKPKEVRFNVNKSTNLSALKAGPISIEGILIYYNGIASKAERKPKPIYNVIPDKNSKE